MAEHSDTEILDAFRVLSDVVNGGTGHDTLVRAFADEHPTLQMGFYRAMNAGLLRRMREECVGGGILPASGMPDSPPSDRRVAEDVATFARHAYVPLV